MRSATTGEVSSTGTVLDLPKRQRRFVPGDSRVSDRQALVSDITYARRQFTRHGDPRHMTALYDSYWRKNSDLRSAVALRVSGLDSRPVRFLAPPESATDPAAIGHAQTLQTYWGRLKGSRIVRHLVRSARMYGLGAAEIGWSATADGFVPTDLWTVATNSMMVATVDYTYGQTPGTWLLRQSTTSGDPLIPGKWILCTPNPELPIGDRSLMSTSIFDAVFAQSVLASWTINLERYGLPVAHAEIEDWTDDALVEFTRYALQRLGEDHVLVTGKADGVKISFLDGAVASRNATSDPHARYLDAVGDRVARLWLGGTLMQRTGNSGSYNQGAVHENSFWSVLQGDARLIEEALQDGLVNTYARLNGVPEAQIPRVSLRVRLDTPAAAANLAALLGNAGYDMAVEELTEALGFQISKRVEGMPSAPVMNVGQRRALLKTLADVVAEAKNENLSRAFFEFAMAVNQ